MNDGACAEPSVPKHRVGGHRDLEQDIWGRVSHGPVYLSAFSRETELIDTRGHLRELAHKITEVEPCHRLPSASWRPGGRGVQPESEGAGARSSDDREQKGTGRASSSRQRKTLPASTSFVLVRPQRIG